ncbi:ATP-binding protein [Streptomyces sp. ISL-86]|uniref:ATP-binding protein n=1 Tax=Streptomyces sp. ISL-86 TaxID=2819187 RepID=UPI001BE7489F|nr:ATP-binding protein [Streptomyces sp. ISL-86]MBT2453223.1 ATP-binding protein [Streptomyces sp. ISL-86]
MSMFETAAIGNPAYTTSLPRLPESARPARRLVSSALHLWELEEAEDAALIVISELVSNAVAHARSESIRVIVTRQDDHVVQLAVVDLSRELPELRLSGSDDESGRGLALVDALSDGKWGAETLPWGKRVWAELTVAKEQPSE